MHDEIPTDGKEERELERERADKGDEAFEEDWSLRM